MDLIAIRQLVSIIRKVRPAVVHAHTPKAGLCAMIASALTRTPVRIYHLRGLPLVTARGFKRVVLAAVERVSCALADQVVCVSHSLSAEAVRLRLCKRGKMRVLANGSGQGVDAQTRFNPALVRGGRGQIRSKFGIPHDALVVGFVGRLCRDKGVAELAYAWQRLHREFDHIFLMLVGPWEERDRVPPSLRTQLEEDERVVVVGLAYDTPSLYAAMDLVVLPSYREGFPNVPLEAAAMELPVVTTSVIGAVDSVLDGETGTLVPAGDVETLAAAIRKYVTAPDVRREHGVRGRRWILDAFDPSAIQEELGQLYSDLLERRHGRSTSVA